MATLRFAILQEVKDYDAKIALEYDQGIALAKIQDRVRDHLTGLVKWNKKRFTQAEVRAAVEKAFIELVDEVKKQTVKLV